MVSERIYSPYENNLKILYTNDQNVFSCFPAIDMKRRLWEGTNFDATLSWLDFFSTRHTSLSYGVNRYLVLIVYYNVLV